MRAVRAFAMLAACFTKARALTVEAGTLTTVTVAAPLYDTTTSADGGCSPEGCVGDNTRVSSAEHKTTSLPYRDDGTRLFSLIMFDCTISGFPGCQKLI